MAVFFHSIRHGQVFSTFIFGAEQRRCTIPFNQEKYKLIRKLDCSLSQEEAETAVRQNSAAINYFLSTRKLLVDTGDDPLVDSWAFEEGMPVRGCDEPNAIAVLPYRNYCPGKTS